MLHHLVRWVTSYPRACLALSLAVAVFFGAFAPFVQTVNNVDYFTLEDHPDTIFYEEFKKTFGNDEFFLIAFERADIFTPENLRMIRDLTEKLEELDDVRRVVSIANANETVGGDGFFEVRPFLEDIPEDPEALQDLKRRALDNPLFVRQVISEDATTTAIVVFPYQRPHDADFRKRLLEQTEQILALYRSQHITFHLAGWTVTNFYLSQYMKRDIAVFIPLTYGLIGLTLFLIFRNWRLTLLGVANISLCLASTMGLFRISGITLNNVTTVVPPLIMALSLADTVHIFSHLDEERVLRYRDSSSAVRDILHEVINPCFLTTLTTAVGFLSLLVSHIPPIRQFGFLAASGMAFEFFFAFVFLPPALARCQRKHLFCSNRSMEKLDRCLFALWTQIKNYHGRILIIFAGLILVSINCATRIDVDTNILEYFGEESPIRRSVDFVEKRLAGVGSLDIVAGGADEQAFLEPSNLLLVEDLEKRIRSLPRVDVVTSIVEFLKQMNRAFHDHRQEFYALPDSRELTAQYMLLYGEDDLENFLDASYAQARISVRISAHHTSRQKEVIDQVSSLIESLQGGLLKWSITGRALQEVNTNRELVKSQVASLALAGTIIFLLLFVTFRSVEFGLLCLVANLFPIVLNFGIMGIVGIPLNAATALISAVALGIAVDDTIHFLSAFAGSQHQCNSPAQATRNTILTKGRAIVVSSAILCTGYGVLTTSHFIPTFQFGLLSTAVMVAALAGDLILLPALLVFVSSFRMKLNL